VHSGLGEIGEAPALPLGQKGDFHGARPRQKVAPVFFAKSEKSSGAAA
jgi:hypothetical protein